MQKKPWHTSKTIRFNVFAAVMMVAEVKFNLLQPLLPLNFYALLGFVLPVVNTALRIITTQGVKL